MATTHARKKLTVHRFKVSVAGAVGGAEATVNPAEAALSRVPKSVTMRFRVDPLRAQEWNASLTALRVDDFSSYARQAIDRAIYQDLRSKDPKWQKFIEASRPLAVALLGRDLSDRASDRTENLTEIETMLAARAAELQGRQD